MDVYVVDTQALVWFIAEDPKLSAQPRTILEGAEEAEVEVLVPTIVLAEVAYIAQKKRVKVAIEEVLKRLEEGDGFAIVPFDLALFREMLRLPQEWEIHESDYRGDRALLRSYFDHEGRDPAGI
jgi:predicted nucleic acid-binding protein